MKKIHLTGCQRLTYLNVLYVKKDQSNAHPIYNVEDKVADYLLKSFDQSTGYNFFEVYTGDEDGVVPGTIQDDMSYDKVTAKGPKPQDKRRAPTERLPRGGRGPKPTDNPIEDDTGAVTI